MSYFYKITHPEIFQGSTNWNNYFEGWYLKNVSKDLNNIISFIPGISLSKDRHAFIQVVDGAKSEARYFKFPLKDFQYNKKKFDIHINDNHFSKEGCMLNLNNDEISISGKLNFSNHSSLPQSFLNPGIMGWFSYMPFMQAKHGVVSLDHKINGSLMVNNQAVDFTGGKGYIEKDWGTSFPKDYLWLQCNHFNNPSISLMLSVAKIPWLGKSFIGFLGFLKIKEKIYRFATYNRSKIATLRKINQDDVEIIIQTKNLTINILAYGGKFQALKSPLKGEMSGRIKESITTRIKVRVEKNNQIILEDQGYPTGFEVHNKILEYFN